MYPYISHWKGDSESYLPSCPLPGCPPPSPCPCAPPSGWRGQDPVCHLGPVPPCRPASAAQCPAASPQLLPVKKGGRFDK
ncbi:MAG: hypothetical protein ACK55Z_26855 [bacterium]